MTKGINFRAQLLLVNGDPQILTSCFSLLRVLSSGAFGVTETDTNTVTQVTTNSTGYYEAPLLSAGNYEIIVTANGFKKVIRSGLSLDGARDNIPARPNDINNTVPAALERTDDFSALPPLDLQ